MDIPGIFEIYNEAMVYGLHERARMFYGWIKEEQRADKCARCGECEELCPQKVPIMEWLEKAQQFFSG